MTNIIQLAIALIFLAETERGLVPYDNKGKLQITQGFVDDVNRISRKQFTRLDRLDFGKSCEMAHIWLNHYKPLVERKTGKTMNEYDLAVMFNVGMNGYLRGDGAEYRAMIERKLALLNPSDALLVALNRKERV